MKTLIGTTALACALVFAPTTYVVAGDTNCPPSGGGVLSGTYENVIADAGHCRLFGATVEGNLKVENLATVAIRGSTFGGNIQGDGAGWIRMNGNTIVEGDIQIKNSQTEQRRRGNIIRGEVGGNVQLEENNNSQDVSDTEIGGDLQLFKNNSRSLVSGNTIGGNLQCKENMPSPTPDAVNMVGGDKEDQCKRKKGF